MTLQNPEMECPECHDKIGGTHRDTVYGHAVHCLHLPDKGAERDLQSVLSGDVGDAGHTKKAVVLLKAALGEK